MSYKSPIILVGANGQVGQEIKELAKDRDLVVVALDRQQLDISDPDAVSGVFEKLRPAIVINAAAYTAVDQAEEDRHNVFQVNHQGVANLASACSEYGVSLIHISTDYVFSGLKETPYVEDDQAGPTGLYGLSKWQGEEAVRSTLEKHLIVRVSWVFGAHGHNFVKTMLRFGKDRNVLTVVSDQYGCPTYASHIAATILALSAKIIDNPDHVQWGTYHFCGEPATTWNGFAEEILRQAQHLGLIDHPVSVMPINTADYPTAAQRPQNSVLDCSKIKNIFGIHPGNWQDGLKDMLNRINWKS